mmetsp:Transcript_95252/g.274338  ORF Transcript_95252/g.274338 Transcript_95252/m.274338 type:complete len:302 (+) Transcript_95252:1194-2099(+)
MACQDLRAREEGVRGGADRCGDAPDARRIGDAQHQPGAEAAHLVDLRRPLGRSPPQGAALSVGDGGVVVEGRCLVLRGPDKACHEGRKHQRDCDVAAHHGQHPGHRHERGQQGGCVRRACPRHRAKHDPAWEIHVLHGDVDEEGADEEHRHPMPIGPRSDFGAGDLEKGHKHRGQERRHIDRHDFENPAATRQANNGDHGVGLGVLMDDPDAQEHDHENDPEDGPNQLLGLPHAAAEGPVRFHVHEAGHARRMPEVRIVLGHRIRPLHLQGCGALEQAATSAEGRAPLAVQGLRWGARSAR